MADKPKKKALPSLPITIDLELPVKDFGKDVTQLVIARHPNGYDAVEIEDLGAKAASYKLMERICGLSPEAAMNVAWVDVAKFERAIAPFVS